MPLTNFEIERYYENDVKLSLKNETNFNGVCKKNDLPKTKDGAYVKNLDEYESIGTHWLALYVNAKNETYFDSFRVSEFQKRLKKL